MDKKDTAYLSVHWVHYHLHRKVIIRNVGETPLRITNVISSTLSQRDWKSKYCESVDSLIRTLKSLEVWAPLETDIVVLPGSEDTTRATQGMKRKMDLREFEHARDSTGKLVLYPFELIEYEDLFGHKYTVLYMEHSILPVVTTEGRTGVVVGEVEAGIERYRWDLPL